MNWLDAFWKKLTAPQPGAARKIYTSSTPSTPPAEGELPNAPVTTIRKTWHYDPLPISHSEPYFTPRAQQALTLAREEADRFHHNFVGTEHVLLGLVALGQGTAVHALKSLGIDPQKIRSEIERNVGTGPDQKMIGLIPYTPRVRKVLSLAAKEAKALHHTYVGTEHILLGLLREGDGVAARVMRNLGVDVTKARTEIQLASRNSAGAEPTDSGPTAASTRPPSTQLPIYRTPRAQAVLEFAREDVQQRNLQFIGTEHILLGLVRLKDQGVAVNVLAKYGVTANVVEAQVEALAGRRAAEKIPFEIQYAPLAIEFLQFAAEEAEKFCHTYIGTEHFLLALLRQTDGGAIQIFKNLKVDLEAMRREILRELQPSDSGSPAAAEISGPIPPSMDRSELPRDHFTPRVRRAFTLALAEAEQRKQPLVETEHVLLGLLRMGQGVAAGVLIKIGVNAEIVAARIPDRTAPEAAETSAEPPHFSPLVREVLTFAAEEARALEHTYLGTEHVLLGLLRQPHGGAARILQELYVDAEALRKQVLIAFEVKTVDPGSRAREKGLLPFEKDTEMFAKKVPLQTNPATPRGEPVDIAQRYDVYCVEHQKMAVYRNVRFKSVKSLFSPDDPDQSSDFVELEQPDGQILFVAKSSIVRFCSPGAKPEIENL